MNKNSGMLVLLLLTALVSCGKRDNPIQIDEPPVFSLAFEGDSSAVPPNLTAGQKETYLFTRFETDDKDVLVFQGAFAKEQCPLADCPGTFIVQFRNIEKGNNVEPDSAFAIGFYLYREPAFQAFDTLQIVAFSASGIPPGSQVLWRISNPEIGVITQNASVFTQEFFGLDTLHIRLDVVQPNGFKSITHQTFRFDKNTCLQASMRVQHDSMAVSPYLLTALTNPPVGNFLYAWNNDQFTQAIVVDTLDNDPDQTFSVTVTDTASTCQASVSVSNLLNAPPLVETPLLSFDLTVDVIPKDTDQLGRVALIWIDGKGTSWRSDRNLQQDPYFFQIQESDDYDLNENGEKTRKMNIRFACWLFDDSGNARPLRGEGVIAVAFP